MHKKEQNWVIWSDVDGLRDCHPEWSKSERKMSVIHLHIHVKSSPGCSLEGLMLKLKLQSFGHLMRRTDSLEKTLMLGKVEGGRKGRQRLRWLDGITDSMDMSLNKLQLVMPTNDLILCCPLLQPSIFPSIRVFSNKSALHIRWPKYWSFSFSIIPSKNTQDRSP